MSDVFIEHRLIDTITYWGFPVPNEFGGGTFPVPVTFRGRWVDQQDLFIDAQGREVRSNAVVFCSRDVAIGGYLFHGTSAESDPTTVSGAREIRAFRKVSSLDVTTYVRKAFL